MWSDPSAGSASGIWRAPCSSGSARETSSTGWAMGLLGAFRPLRRGDLEFQVRWLPFQLDPSASEKPSSRMEAYAKKFGKGKEEVKEMGLWMMLDSRKRLKVGI